MGERTWSTRVLWAKNEALFQPVLAQQCLLTSPQLGTQRPYSPLKNLVFSPESRVKMTKNSAKKTTVDSCFWDKYVTRFNPSYVQSQNKISPEKFPNHLDELINKACLDIDIDHLLFQLIIKWVKEDPPKRQKCLPELLEKVDFRRMSDDFLLNEVYQESLIIELIDCPQWLYGHVSDQMKLRDGLFQRRFPSSARMVFLLKTL